MAIWLDYEAREPARNQGHPHPSTPPRNLDLHARSYLLQQRCAVVQPPIYEATNRILECILAVCRRRERISSRPAEFQTMPSAWQLASLQAMLPARNASRQSRLALLSFAMILSVILPACRTDHLGIKGATRGCTRLGTRWLFASCPDQATNVWAGSRSSSVVNLLGPAPVPPGPSRPAPVRLSRRLAVYAEPVSNSISWVHPQGCSFAAGKLLEDKRLPPKG